MYTQLCPTLCYSPRGSSVLGTFPERILEWVAIASSWGSSQLRDWTHCSLHFPHYRAYSLLLSHLGNPRQSMHIGNWFRIGFPDGASAKEHTCQCRRCQIFGLDPWVGEISWRWSWQPTPIFLPGESHGQKSLACYSPWGHTESDTLLKGLSTH